MQSEVGNDMVLGFGAHWLFPMETRMESTIGFIVQGGGSSGMTDWKLKWLKWTSKSNINWNLKVRSII